MIADLAATWSETMRKEIYQATAPDGRQVLMTGAAGKWDGKWMLLGSERGEEWCPLMFSAEARNYTAPNGWEWVWRQCWLAEIAKAA